MNVPWICFVAHCDTFDRVKYHWELWIAEYTCVEEPISISCKTEYNKFGIQAKDSKTLPLTAWGTSLQCTIIKQMIR